MGDSMNRSVPVVAAALMLGSSASPNDHIHKQQPVVNLDLIDPDDPMSYFEAAEEIAFEAHTADGLNTAYELTLMSWLIASENAPSPAFDRSVTLLLADIVQDNATRLKLLELAGTLDTPLDQTQVDPSRLGLIRLIASVRRGDWSELREILGVLDLDEVLGELQISSQDQQSVLALIDRFEDEPERPQTVRVQSRTSLDPDADDSMRFETILNPDIQGDPSPRLAQQEHLLLIRVEAAALGVAPQEWGSAFIMTGDLPVRLWSLEEAAAESGLTADQPVPSLIDGQLSWAKRAAE